MAETIEYEQFERDAEPAPDGSAPPGGPAADGAAADAVRAGADLARLGEVPMQLSVELGRTQLTVAQTLDLRPGSVIELERAAGAARRPARQRHPDRPRRGRRRGRALRPAHRRDPRLRGAPGRRRERGSPAGGRGAGLLLILAVLAASRRAGRPVLFLVGRAAVSSHAVAIGATKAGSGAPALKEPR